MLAVVVLLLVPSSVVVGPAAWGPLSATGAAALAGLTAGYALADYALFIRRRQPPPRRIPLRRALIALGFAVAFGFVAAAFAALPVTVLVFGGETGGRVVAALLARRQEHHSQAPHPAGG